MADIHVLCAPPLHPNTGMTTVDLAFGSLIDGLGSPSVTYWRLWDPSEATQSSPQSERAPDARSFRDRRSGLVYQSLRDRLEEFLDARAVVFWGDFLHMAVYMKITADTLTKTIPLFADRARADEYVANHLLLRGQGAEVLDRTISYGTTLGFNTARDYAAPYGSDLAAFLSGARRVWVRDTYSAHVAQLARAPREETCKGTDAALLLGERDRRPREETMGVFIGRSSLQPEAVAAFGRHLAQQARLTPQWLDWGRAPSFWPMEERRRLRAAWPGLEHQAIAPTFGDRLSTYGDVARAGHADKRSGAEPPVSDLLDEIGRHRVIVTDTYHLAVNAWRIGTPAICIVDRPTSATWDVNSGGTLAARDKRAELYSQLEATPYLVSGEDLRRRAKRAAEEVARHLEDDDTLAVIRSRIDSMRRQSSAQVTSTLAALLDRR